MVCFSRLSLFASVTPVSVLGSQCPERDFGVCFQRALDGVATHFRKYHPDLVMQLAWKTASEEVTAVSGVIGSRNATVDDTFLFGSGTKPITATAVMRLIDSGRIQADTPLCEVVDPYLQKFRNTTLASLYGDEVCEATVLNTVRMAAGIKDFEDVYDFDVKSLTGGVYQEYPFESMEYASEIGNKSLTCRPGTCTAYSSTSFEVAGLVLAATLNPEQPWFNLDLGAAALPDPALYPSLTFPPVGPTEANGTISDHLTVPCISSSSHWPDTLIGPQNPAILGWTCGSMVGSTLDVARFYFDLLGPDAKIVSPTSRAEMIHFTPLTTGWKAFELNYSAGFEEKDYSRSSGSHPVGIDHFNYGWGHGGVTYGFSSDQAFIPRANASFSVASNTDATKAKDVMSCWVLDIASEVYTGEPAGLNCGYLSAVDTVV